MRRTVYRRSGGAGRNRHMSPPWSLRPDSVVIRPCQASSARASSGPRGRGAPSWQRCRGATAAAVREARRTGRSKPGPGRRVLRQRRQGPVERLVGLVEPGRAGGQALRVGQSARFSHSRIRTRSWRGSRLEGSSTARRRRRRPAPPARPCASRATDGPARRRRPAAGGADRAEPADPGAAARRISKVSA